MSNDNNGFGVLATGCGFAAFLLVGVAYLFFGRAGVSSGVPGPTAAGTAAIERGFQITGGELLPKRNDQQKFVVDVELTKGWSLSHFQVDSMTVIVGSEQYPVTLTGPPPEMPVKKSFRLTFQSVHAQPVHEGQAPLFQLDVNSKADSGFFGSKVQSDSSYTLRIVGNRLVPQ